MPVRQEVSMVAVSSPTPVYRPRLDPPVGSARLGRDGAAEPHLEPRRFATTITRRSAHMFGTYRGPTRYALRRTGFNASMLPVARGYARNRDRQECDSTHGATENRAHRRSGRGTAGEASPPHRKSIMDVVSVYRGDLAVRRRALPMMRCPASPAAVRIDSGWNWTANRFRSGSSMAMTTSSVIAVAVKPSRT